MELIPFTGTRSNYVHLSQEKSSNDVYRGDEMWIIGWKQEHLEKSRQLRALCLAPRGATSFLHAGPGWSQSPTLVLRWSSPLSLSSQEAGGAPGLKVIELGLGGLEWGREGSESRELHGVPGFLQGTCMVALEGRSPF